MRSSRYKHYVLIVLMLLFLFSYVDRLALGVVLQDIKLEFSLTDTQLGLLSGISFALFYSVMGVPIARLADRGDRVAIIACCAILWSVAVAACGLAATFAQLLLIRVVVAVGEAGCNPSALSLIADYFTRAERPRATAIYGLAGVLCTIPGYWLAGWANQLYGWRVTFMLLSAPGVVLGVLAWLTVREPRRAHESFSMRAEAEPPLKEVARTLWRNVTFRHLAVCYAVLSFLSYGLGQWYGPFFIRSHGLETDEIGAWLTGVVVLGTLVGTYVVVKFVSRYALQNERLQLQGMAIAFASSGVITMCVYLSSSPYWAFAFIGLAAIGSSTINGPLISTIQTLIPERMRAVAFALVFLLSNLIGAGLGPLATGALSDLFQPWAGNESLRYALLALTPGSLWVAWHAWRASRTVTDDLANVALDKGSVALI